MSLNKEEESDETIRYLNEILETIRETYSSIPDEASKQLGERVCEKVNQIYAKPPIRSLEWLSFIASNSNEKLSSLSSSLTDSSSFLNNFTSFNTLLPSISQREAREIIFNPTSEKDIRIFSLSLFFLLFNTENNEKNEIFIELRKFSLFLLSLIFLVYKKNKNFIKKFIINGGLIPLIELLSHTNIYERSQALEILLTLTDSEEYDWFKEDDTDEENKKLLECLASILFLHTNSSIKSLSLTYSDQLISNEMKDKNEEFSLPFFFKDINNENLYSSFNNNFLLKCLWSRDNWTENYMSMRILQLLAMLSSLFRLKFSIHHSELSKTFLINFSDDFMSELQSWSLKGSNIEGEGVENEAIKEESQLALTLYEDFSKNRHDGIHNSSSCCSSSSSSSSSSSASYTFVYPSTLNLQNLFKKNKNCYNIIETFNIFYNILLKYNHINLFYNNIYNNNNNDSYINYLIENKYYNFEEIFNNKNDLLDNNFLNNILLIKFMLNLKEIGNNYYKNYNFLAAVQAYEKSSLCLLVFLIKYQEEMLDKLKEENEDYNIKIKLKSDIILLLIILYNNLSNSYWKLFIDNKEKLEKNKKLLVENNDENNEKLEEEIKNFNQMKENYLNLSEFYSLHALYLSPINSKAAYRFVLILLEKEKIDDASQFIDNIFTLSKNSSDSNFSFSLPSLESISSIISINENNNSSYTLLNYLKQLKINNIEDIREVSTSLYSSFSLFVPNETLDLLKRLKNKCLALKIIKNHENNEKINPNEWNLDQNKIKYLSKLMKRQQLNQYLPLNINEIQDNDNIIDSNEKLEKKEKRKDKSSREISDSLTQKELKELDDLFNLQQEVPLKKVVKKKSTSSTSTSSTSKNLKEKKQKLQSYFEIINKKYTQTDFDQEFLSILREFLQEYNDITKIFSLSNMTEDHLIYFFNFILKYYKDEKDIIIKVSIYF